MFQGMNTVWGPQLDPLKDKSDPTSRPGQGGDPRKNQISGDVNMGTHLQDDKPNQAMRSIGGKMASQALGPAGGMIFSALMAKEDEANRWLRPTRKLESVDGSALNVANVQTQIPGPLGQQQPSQEELMRMQMKQQGGYRYG